MDWEAAIHYARMVQTAELINPDQVCPPSLIIPRQGQPVKYAVLATIFANDLATESNQSRRELIVSIGFIAQDELGNVVVAIRGTHGIHEWLHDCLYFSVQCPFLPEAGLTEDGFTEVYMSLRVDTGAGSQHLREAIAGMEFPLPVKSMTVSGHSLGAALCTLLALDLAANTQYKDLTLYNFASPRTGNDRFAAVFNRYVPKAYRIANRMDLVTQVPPDLLSHENRYQHVEAVTELVPDAGVEQHLLCMHHLSTYMHLMAKLAGLNLEEYPIVEECVCRPGDSFLHRLEERLKHHGQTQVKTEAALRS